ncbi:MAG: L-threonylcarbamoyladenylate synthase [Acidobacteria bacterium]|nr:L-threonylcarbamoyladenylate synthase [Acidobacteriota bacterium]
MVEKIFPNKDNLRRAAELIRAGKLVAFPTETVYGLGANALDACAVERIFAAKGRPSTSPLIVHVDSAAMARELVERWPDAAEALAARYWPGPLTLVLPKRPLIPDVVTAGLATAGLRVPAHPVALDLIRESGVPIAAPSANRFTQLSPTTAEHVRESLGDSVDLILDGGQTTVGIESTVLSLVDDCPVLLRPGMVTQIDIEALIGPVEIAGRIENGAHPSPGMHRRHYSPRTRLVLVGSGALPEGRGAYLWVSRFIPAPKAILMPQTAAAYASALYDTLHRLDSEGWEWIAVERPPAGPEWAGINDRLERAAARG